MILLFNVVSPKLVFTMSEQEISGPVDAIHTGLGADHPTHFSLIGTIRDDEGRGLAYKEVPNCQLKPLHL